jgi:hypothetical protein
MGRALAVLRGRSKEERHMKTLICGSAPIGRWLALGMEKAGPDMRLVAS